MTPCVQLYMCKVVNNGHLYIMMDMMSICDGLSVCIIILCQVFSIDSMLYYQISGFSSGRERLHHSLYFKLVAIVCNYDIIKTFD